MGESAAGHLSNLSNGRRPFFAFFRTMRDNIQSSKKGCWASVKSFLPFFRLFRVKLRDNLQSSNGHWSF